MSIGKKYSSDCGCDTPVQTAPTPCCEAHNTVCIPGVCFRPTCSIAATDGHFFLTFKNVLDGEKAVPLNNAEIGFFHQGAGYLNIHLWNGHSFEVSLVDPSKEGYIISEDDCVIVVPLPESVSGSGSNRCVTGLFYAPAVNASSELFIWNGSGIPIGSNITFSYNGELGTYEVTQFLSASGNIYSYFVMNTGGGHTPGTIINGGEAGNCAIPVEIITDIDLCGLSASEHLDSFVGCVDGSPRKGTSGAAGSTWVGDGEGGWDQAQLAATDCCVRTQGVLKFSGNGCVDAEDTTILAVNIPTCFSDAWNVAGASGSYLMANIAGRKIIITAFNPGTRSITARLGDMDALDESEAEFIEYPANTQICLGECCAQCTNGAQITETNTDGGDDPTRASAFVFDAIPLPFDATLPKHYLIGYNTSQVVTVTEITTAYNASGLEAGIGKPLVTDPLVMRQKICNTDTRGCNQEVEVQLNYNIAIAGMPANLRAFFELGSFISESATLSDGTTPNPFTEISSQADAADYIDGPSYADTDVAESTSLGVGNITNVKVLPRHCGFLIDHTIIRNCGCANNRVWFYVRLQPLVAVTAGTATLRLEVRRHIIKRPANKTLIPKNDPALEGFA